MTEGCVLQREGLQGIVIHCDRPSLKSSFTLQENLLWQARYSGNSNLMNKAHNYPTNSCNNLEKLYNRGG